jgi:hypothetical protein
MGKKQNRVKFNGTPQELALKVQPRRTPMHFLACLDPVVDFIHARAHVRCQRTQNHHTEPLAAHGAIRATPAL